MESLNRIVIHFKVFFLALSIAPAQAADSCLDTNTGVYNYCEYDCCSTGDEAPCCEQDAETELIVGCVLGGIFFLCCAGIITAVVLYKFCKRDQPGARQGAVVNPIQTTVVGSVGPNANGTRAFSTSHNTNLPNSTYQPPQFGGQNNQYGNQTHYVGGTPQNGGQGSQYNGQPPTYNETPPPAYSTIASAPPLNPNEINGLSQQYPPPPAFYATKGQ